MKVLLAGLLGVCAFVSLACGPEGAAPSGALGTSTAGLRRVISQEPNDINFSLAVINAQQTTGGTTTILVSPVYRTPSGGCALGTGPIGSPGYMTGMMNDLNKCKERCPSGVDGFAAVEDGSGGCKLVCDCHGDGLGWVDAAAEVLPPTP